MRQNKLTALLFLTLPPLSAALNAAQESHLNGSATLSAPSASSLSAQLQKSVLQAKSRVQLIANLGTNASVVCNRADSPFQNQFEKLPKLLPFSLTSQSLPGAAHGN